MNPVGDQRICIMSSEQSQPPKRQGRLQSKDIGSILKGWDYESGTINVRKVTGNDGRPKLQMRLDLGLLQMEMTGRPDGNTPQGCESLLEFHEIQLDEHRRSNGSDLGFHLTADQCQSLREEAVMYYHRYLSLFVLEEFSGVVRDTARNLRLIDLCSEFAEDEHDRLILEQYRPYLIMMNVRAKASLAFAKKDYKQALSDIQAGLTDIREFFRRFGQEAVYSKSNEVRVLRRFARDIKRKMPVDPIARLQSRLDKAVKDERYEEAAQIRDEMLAINAAPVRQSPPRRRKARKETGE